MPVVICRIQSTHPQTLVTTRRWLGYMPEICVTAFYNTYNNILQLVRTEIYVLSVKRYFTFNDANADLTPFFTRFWVTVSHGIVNLDLCSTLTGVGK